MPESKVAKIAVGTETKNHDFGPVPLSKVFYCTATLNPSTKKMDEINLISETLIKNPFTLHNGPTARHTTPIYQHVDHDTFQRKFGN